MLHWQIRKLIPSLAAVVAMAMFAAPSLAQAPEGGVHEIRMDNTVLTVSFTGQPGDDAREKILEWITRSARAVSLYYGRFPVKEALIFVNPYPGRGITGGRAYGGTRPRITINAGTSSTQEDYARDWRLVHEMIHMAFPMLNDSHDWMTEGLAVYVESVARLQAGDLDEETVWKGFVDGMRNGLPEAGDKGLDHTPTWGRKYWGGAIFCLVADLEIRRLTQGKKSLRDALRGVLLASGDHRTHWPLRRALETGDVATGTTVLMDLYKAWGAAPVNPGLPELWERLGVLDRGRSVSFDDTAALALMRKEIGKPPGS